MGDLALHSVCRGVAVLWVTQHCTVGGHGSAVGDSALHIGGSPYHQSWFGLDILV